MDFRALRYFVAVAEHLNSGAGRDTQHRSLAEPAIRALEDEFGVVSRADEAEAKLTTAERLPRRVRHVISRGALRPARARGRKPVCAAPKAAQTDVMIDHMPPSCAPSGRIPD